MRGCRAAILEHLKKYGSITSMEAFQQYGATRLSAIVFDLRKLGYDIITHTMSGKTRFGESCQYAKYVLREEKQ